MGNNSVTGSGGIKGTSSMVASRFKTWGTTKTNTPEAQLASILESAYSRALDREARTEARPPLRSVHADEANGMQQRSGTR